MPKTIEEGFDTLIGRLQPLSSENGKAQSHKNSVESCLKNGLSCSKFFETGSFGSGTGVRHYSDTDYFAVIPSSNLWADSAYSLKIVKETIQRDRKSVV